MEKLAVTVNTVFPAEMRDPRGFNLNTAAETRTEKFHWQNLTKSVKSGLKTLDVYIPGYLFIVNSMQFVMIYLHFPGKAVHAFGNLPSKVWRVATLQHRFSPNMVILFISSHNRRKLVPGGAERWLSRAGHRHVRLLVAPPPGSARTRRRFGGRNTQKV